MTENQFLEEMSFYQRRFERLHRAIIKDMKQYINKNPAYDSTFYKTVENISANITLTLPSASINSGRIIVVGKFDDSQFTLTFSTAIKQTKGTTISSINYAVTFTLQSDGSNWWIIAKN